MKNVLNNSAKTNFDIATDLVVDMGVGKYTALEVTTIGLQVVAERIVIRAISKRFPKTAKTLRVVTNATTLAALGFVGVVAYAASRKKQEVVEQTIAE